MKRNLLYPLLLILITSITYSACSKNTPGTDSDLCYKMLSDKTWYLDYLQIFTGTTIKTKTYTGQSTYFINFLKDLSTLDSDGINGNYTILKIDGRLQIHVQAKTSNGSYIEYNYNIESMGDKHMILTYSFTTVTTKLYYSYKK